MNEISEKLKAPFPASAISWRAGATNKNKTPDKKPTKCIALAYIDARDVMNRLDEILGLDWQCKYSHANGKTICDIGIFIDDGNCSDWIWRANGAGDSDVEAEKGAISDAFKRAAVMFGVGRYLYDLPNVWVECDEWGHIKNPPSLPAWALPSNEPAKPKHPLDAPAYDPVTPEIIEALKEKAAEIVDFHTKGMFEDAFVVFDEISDSAERQELWTLLKPNSAVRTKLTSIGQEKRKLNS